MQNKNKATAVLAACASAAAVTLPGISPFAGIASASVNGNFFLNLFNHGFLAATIGGLADWFAVTALFRKPLGIGFRTEILRRNRQRIMEAIVEFVGTDLLNTKNIMDTVKDENTAALLIDFFERNKGREKIKSVAVEVLAEVLSKTDTAAFAKNVTPILEDEIRHLDTEKLIDAAVKVITNEKHSRRILVTIFETGEKILKSPHIQESILEKITQLREAYEGDSAGRALVLSSMNLTDEKILNILNENAEKKISETIAGLNFEGMPDSKKSEIIEDLLEGFEKFVRSVAADIDGKKILNTLKNLFKDEFDSEKYLTNWLNVNIKGETDSRVLDKLNRMTENPYQSRIVKVEKNTPIWYSAVENLIDEKIDNFIQSPVQQEKFDKLIKSFIENLLETYHDQIPGLIRERLDKFSDDELTEFVEGKVSDDLQMIRINGSVCGGIVGMFLYVVSVLISRVV